MGLFQRSQPGLLGIDVTSTSVKLIELSRDGARFRVESYAVEPLPEQSVVEKNIQDVNAVGECLRKAVKRCGSRVRNCALAVSGSAVITKVLSMPASLTDAERAAQIELDAEQYIPFALNEVNMDFTVLGPTPQAKDSVDVLLVASRSENVESRAVVAELGGLTAKVVDVEPYCVEAVFAQFAGFKPGDAEKLTAVLDFGASTTTLNVLRGKQLIYTREQAFGGRELTEEIMRRYNLSYQEAGQKKKDGKLPDDYRLEVLEPFMESMVQQVSRFLQFFYSATQHTTVDQIVLAGGCASIEGIVELVEGRMAISTAIVDPFAGMSIGGRVNADRLRKDSAALLVACGLALRSFD
jgi:type IV pilus assembly protein PilM